MQLSMTRVSLYLASKVLENSSENPYRSCKKDYNVRVTAQMQHGITYVGFMHGLTTPLLTESWYIH